MARRLPVAFFARDATIVAPELLGATVVVGECSGVITEVEAYTSDDPASHTFRGQTPRNAVMYGPAGRWYVYFTYGMHHCANIVTGAVGDGQAVLLRSVRPVLGVDVMRVRRSGGRGARPDRSLTDGPGKLAQAFALDLDDNGARAVVLQRPSDFDDAAVVVGPRVGITKAVDWPRRWRLVPAG